MSEGFESFQSWQQLLDHIKAGYALWYQAPLDHTPVQVSALLRRTGQLRVSPMWHSDADDFLADMGHLSRFRRRASRLEKANG